MRESGTFQQANDIAQMCATPGCRKACMDGGIFCTECKTKLARVKQELEAPGRARLYGSKGKPKRCKFPECPDWAKPKRHFCLHHLRMKGEE